MGKLADTAAGCGALIALFVAALALFVWIFSPEGPPSRTLTPADIDDTWPLTAETVEVRCVDGFQAVAVAEGTAYALNGAAETRGYAPIDPIWKDAPDAPGKISLRPITRRALDLCPDN